jgi:hypothetical protein
MVRRELNASVAGGVCGIKPINSLEIVLPTLLHNIPDNISHLRKLTM